MWSMTFGDKSLSPAEWAVFRYGAAHLYDEIDLDIQTGDKNSYTGIRQFDSLSNSQKLYHLALVSDALSDPHCPAPPLTATLEATIAAVFSLLTILIDFEIDQMAHEESILEDCSLRILLRDVRQIHANEDAAGDLDFQLEVPHPTDTDRSKWRDILDCIHWCINEDEDYEMASRYNRMSALERYTLDICEEYFGTPKRRSAAEVQNARLTLDRVVSGKILRFESV